MSLEHVRQTEDMRRRLANVETIETPVTFRSGLLCYYDGTRWLTAAEYTATFAEFSQTTIASITATGLIQFTRVRTDFAPYFTRAALSTNVSTTNNGSNYWTVSVLGYDQLFSTNTTIWTFNTSGDTVNLWRPHEGITANIPTDNVHIALQGATTGAPGRLYVIGSVYYRLIVP